VTATTAAAPRRFATAAAALPYRTQQCGCAVDTCPRIHLLRRAYSLYSRTNRLGWTLTPPPHILESKLPRGERFMRPWWFVACPGWFAATATAGSPIEKRRSKTRRGGGRRTTLSRPFGRRTSAIFINIYYYYKRGEARAVCIRTEIKPHADGLYSCPPIPHGGTRTDRCTVYI